MSHTHPWVEPVKYTKRYRYIELKFILTNTFHSLVIWVNEMYLLLSVNVPIPKWSKYFGPDITNQANYLIKLIFFILVGIADLETGQTQMSRSLPVTFELSYLQTCFLSTVKNKGWLLHVHKSQIPWRFMWYMQIYIFLSNIEMWPLGPSIVKKTGCTVCTPC